MRARREEEGRHTQEVAEEDSQRQEESREGAELPSEIRTGALSDVDSSRGDTQAPSQSTDCPSCQHQPVPARSEVSHADQEEGGEEEEA